MIHLVNDEFGDPVFSLEVKDIGLILVTEMIASEIEAEVLRTKVC